MANISANLVELPFHEDIQRLTEDFTGREWIFEEIDQWVIGSNETFFILTGEAGIGKSAIAARLTQIRTDIAAHNFCITGRSSTSVPGTVLRSLAAQLGRNLPEYGIALANTIQPEYLSVNVKITVGTMSGGQITGVVIKNLNIADPKQEIESLLTAPLSAMPAPAQPVLILLDSLDEAFTYSPTENLVTLIAGLTNLPRWVRFILTSRPEERVLSYFSPVPKQVVAAESRLNLDDLRRYARYRVSKESLRTRLQTAAQPIPPEVLVERIAGASDDPGLAGGNFLYTKILLNDIQSGVQPLDDLTVLPKSLDEIYHRFLLRLAPEWESRYQPLLAVLAAAREPLARQQLLHFGDQSARLLGGRMSATLVNLALGVLVQFLDSRGEPGEEQYALYHQSLRDYLGDPRRSGRFACPPEDGHGAIAGYYIENAAQDWNACDLYGLKHLPHHLAGAEAGRSLRTLLTDFDWLQAKLNALDVYALVSDYDLLDRVDGKTPPFRIIQSALRRSAHVLSKDRQQLAAQLLGRLLQSKAGEIQHLLAGAGGYRGAAWLRPLTASLAAERSNRWLRPAQVESLSCVAFSPNGLWAAHASGPFGEGPRNVVLWDLEEWRSLGPRYKTLPRLNPYALALSDDVRWCLYADSLGGVYRMDALGGDAWEGHVHRKLTIAKLLAISADGGRALSACQHGRLVAWDIEANLHEIIFNESNNYIDALCLDASGSSAVVGRADGSIVLLDLWPTRQQTLFKLDRPPSALARSADNTLVAAAADGWVEVRSVSSPELAIFSFSIQEKPTSLALSHDRQYLAVGTYGGKVEVWNLKSETRSAQYNGAHTHEVSCLVFSPNSDRVISADLLQIKEWGLESPDEDERDSFIPRTIGEVKVTADGLHAVAVLADGRLGVWNIRTGALEEAIPSVDGPAFGDPYIGSPKGLALAAEAWRVLAWNEHLLCVWDLETGACAGSLPVADTHDAAITPNGKAVVFVNGRDVSRWTPGESASSALGTYDSDSPRYVAISPDGLRALSSGGDRRVVGWRLDAAKRQNIPEQFARRSNLISSWWPASRDKPATIGFTGAEEAIVTTGEGLMFLLRTSEKEIERFEGRHEAYINMLLVAADGRFAVTSSHDQSIMTWDLGSRKRIAVFAAHPGNIEQLSETARRALLFTYDGVLKVISLSDGSLLAAFQGDKQFITCAADAELRYIAACDQGGKMHFLHLEED